MAWYGRGRDEQGYRWENDGFGRGGAISGTLGERGRTSWWTSLFAKCNRIDRFRREGCGGDGVRGLVWVYELMGRCCVAV
jgi:hypothetical protein